jgi:hypothetical protein
MAEARAARNKPILENLSKILLKNFAYEIDQG